MFTGMLSRSLVVRLVHHGDLSTMMRYTRKEQEGGEEWEEMEVSIYETAGDVVDNRTNFQSQDGAPQTPKHPTVQRGLVGGVVLCLVMLAGIITLSIYITLKMSKMNNSKNQLQAKLEATETNFSQLQDEMKKLKNKTEVTFKMSEMNNSNSQLQVKLEAMETNFSQLQDEMKKLKNKTEEICCPDGWITFQCSCYFKSTYWKTWSESRKDCQERGADLVIINSKEEQEFVSKLSSYFWIGLEGTGRGWKWLDGSPLTVTFWEDGQQNSYSSYRVYNNYEGKWNPTYDTVSANWICEKNSSVSVI